jgi:hypothetical protein
MEISNITVRHIDQKQDLPVIAGWLESRGKVFSPVMIPPLGVVAEISGCLVAAAFAHLSVSCGVAFFEVCISRPGLSLAESRAAFSLIIQALKEACLVLDYAVVIVNTEPSIARYMKTQGFSEVMRGQNVQLIHQLK